ncbi:IS110 family transposase [Kitasatospora sp. NBC_00240]|uniref:IS110 family transposase n=1 Tax=Kitasatospora sp. NBC_00240 TaxID=2903567 RepID=UPI002254CBE5|nr:IS110 family transposase [Kitasatospora sp. NBC_00240]MCX5215496.1 IS110 family transposase [Kitasatospora sp. NBC_00240]
MTGIWAGIDAGKGHHHCVALDAQGGKLLSRRIANDEPELLKLIADVLALGEDVTWAIDLADGGAALVIALLVGHGQRVLYIPGRTVNRASAGYRGEGKTDARDAVVIADQARMRRDLMPVNVADDDLTELRLTTRRRTDLVCDRTRAVNRLRGMLTSLFPALERTLDLSNNGPLVLLTGYQTPAGIRRMGASRLETWLRNRKVRGCASLARLAVDAAERQHTAVPGEKATARMVHTLAREVMDLNEKIAEADAAIQAAFQAQPHAEIVTSMPGIGPLLGAEFLAATGGDMALFASPDRLATYAGLAPAPRDSGKISGNRHRPTRYHRGLQRVFYMSAMSSLTCCPDSRRYYGRFQVQ